MNELETLQARIQAQLAAWAAELQRLEARAASPEELEALRAAMAQRLAEWNAELERVKATAGAPGGAGRWRAELERAWATAETEVRRLGQELTRLRAPAGEAWGELRVGGAKAWGELRQALEAALRKLSRPPEGPREPPPPAGS